MARFRIPTPDSGTVYGKLRVLSEYSTPKPRKRRLLCECVCGKVCDLPLHAVISGNTSSCGCLFIEQLSQRTRSHGMSKTPTYRSWAHMKERCLNQDCQDYPDYGGRGIKVCDRWLDSFECFLADMGEKPAGRYSIDRRDTHGNYCPENCQWATDNQQARNRRNNHPIEYNGRTQLLVEWSHETGVRQETIRYRLKNGWSVHEALHKPGDGRNSK